MFDRSGAANTGSGAAAGGGGGESDPRNVPGPL